jgi:hypothetical protein
MYPRGDVMREPQTQLEVRFDEHIDLARRQPAPMCVELTQCLDSVGGKTKVQLFVGQQTAWCCAQCVLANTPVSLDMANRRAWTSVICLTRRRKPPDGLDQRGAAMLAPWLPCNGL